MPKEEKISCNLCKCGEPLWACDACSVVTCLHCNSVIPQDIRQKTIYAFNKLINKWDNKTFPVLETSIIIEDEDKDGLEFRTGVIRVKLDRVVMGSKLMNNLVNLFNSLEERWTVATAVGRLEFQVNVFSDNVPEDAIDTIMGNRNWNEEEEFFDEEDEYED